MTVEREKQKKRKHVNTNIDSVFCKEDLQHRILANFTTEQSYRRQPGSQVSNISNIVSLFGSLMLQ